MRRRFVLVLGGTSDIGRAVAHAFAARGWGVQLAGRDLGLVKREADDVAARHRVPVSALRFDVLDFDGAAGFALSVDPLPDVVVSVVGLMGADDPADVAAVRAVVDTNFTGPAIVLAAFAERFRARGSGTLVGVSSVAGDRGRAKTMTYGAAKAGFTAFLSALRQRLQGTGVAVLTVKPGFVRTRMTEGMDLPALLVAQPRTIADAILRAVERGRPVTVTPAIWRPLMAVVRAIPEPLFRRMRF